MTVTRYYAVTDLETTGLDSLSDVILEAAVILVDQNFTIIDARQSLIHSDDDRYTNALTRTIFGEDQFVNKMHQESGLWDAWNDDAKNPHVTPTAFAVETAQWLDGHGVPPRQAPLLGNSIGSLDRPFIQQMMSPLNDWLSYRNFDVSSWRLGIEDQHPEWHAEWESLLESREEKQHRAMDDALLSIDQIRFYYEKLGLL